MAKKGETMDKRLDVTMAMDALDCPVCYEPLRPPIYQCCVGHFICLACRDRLRKCPLCSRTAFERCFGMEHIMESIVVPCSFAKNGCDKKMAYFDRKGHENTCRHGPCFCPESGCGFTGAAAALRDHFATHHKWPSTPFTYYKPFNLPVKPGPRVLKSQDGFLFLMNMVPAEPVGCAVALVCVQPDATDSRYGCSVAFSCFKGHHQMSTLDCVRSSSLSDGLPKDYFCIVPKPSGGWDKFVLITTVDNELLVAEESDDEDYDDESYEEDDEVDNSDDE
ncbi:hypothetical protein ACP4OV_008681 [Aristida adscensionis]